MATIKRETAKICQIKDLLEGRYIKREGWEPSYVETSRGQISRVNIMGVLINQDSNEFMVDDGSAQILVRSFDQEKKFKIEIGKPILIVGRPRTFNEDMFIVPEIMKIIDNPKWLEFRKVELNIEEKQINESVEEPTTIEAKPEAVENKTVEAKDNPSEDSEEKKSDVDIVDSLLQKISELDKGYGAKIDEVIKFFEANLANRTISRLIEHGEIFEIKPGIVKVL